MFNSVRNLLLVLSLCVCMPLAAQNVNVQSFRLLESDMTANTTGSIELDQNGEKAALIKMVTTQTGFKFDCGSLGIVKIKQDTGEIWVYVPRGVRRITVQHDQYGVLRNYAFPIVIEGARTYEMKLATTPAQTVGRNFESDKQIREANSLPTKVSSITAGGYVALGLSVKWATCNLGASSPEQYGNYYAWGEIKPRTGSSRNYDWNTTPYYKSGKSYKNVKWSKYTGSEDKTILDPEDDAATMTLGSPWRMPTLDEINELLDKCTWTWTKLNGTKGYKIIGPNGNSIFLPAAGTSGGYWSSSLSADNPNRAYYLYFKLTYHDWYDGNRYGGRSIRPVRP